MRKIKQEYTKPLVLQKIMVLFTAPLHQNISTK